MERDIHKLVRVIYVVTYSSGYMYFAIPNYQTNHNYQALQEILIFKSMKIECKIKKKRPQLQIIWGAEWE